MNQKPLCLLYKTDQGIPQLLSKAFHQGQFKEATGKNNHNNWNLYWKACGFTNSDYKNVKRWQILNHFPKGNTITRKDSLARCLKRMRMVYGPVYNFFPASFNLPNDYTKFLSYFTKVQNKKGKQTWICKPSDLSRGRGIFLFDCLSDLLYEGSTVVQRYIDNPYLIGGYKFDLRIYAVVTSYHPLRIYIHQDGLVRFGTEKYAGSMLHNKFAHLTNTSINRNGPSYSTDKERIGAGCKWSISQLRTYFQQCSIDDRLVWERIKHMISLTILMQTNAIPEYAKQSVELYGFDIILDQKLKPWLLEVNFTPALGNDCAADVTVKLPMLVDFLDLARQKMTICRPTTEHHKRNIALSKQNARKKEEPETKDDDSDFDDMFRNRFIMDPEETARIKPGIEKKLTKIPDIPNSSTLIKSSLSIETDSVKSAKYSSIKNPVPVREHSLRSHSSNSFRNSANSTDMVAYKEYKVGGFFLTYPVTNNSQTYSKGVTDIAKAVSEIRNTLRISESDFKFSSPQRRQLYERTTVNWNTLSGLKQT